MPVPRGVRLTFTYDENGVLLHSRTVVFKQPPYGIPAAMLGAEASVLAEVRTQAGEVAYRRSVPRVMPETVEVWSGEGGFAHVAPPSRPGSFTVVVPIEQPGALVVLMARPGPGGTRAELGRFPLFPETVV
jgi:hypothetical protein